VKFFSESFSYYNINGRKWRKKRNNKMSGLILLTFFFRRYVSIRNCSIIESLSLCKFTFPECHRKENAKIGIASYVLYIAGVLYYHDAVNKGDDNQLYILLRVYSRFSIANIDNKNFFVVCNFCSAVKAINYRIN